jgi:hypothetical protein
MNSPSREESNLRGFLRRPAAIQVTEDLLSAPLVFRSNANSLNRVLGHIFCIGGLLFFFIAAEILNEAVESDASILHTRSISLQSSSEEKHSKVRRGKTKKSILEELPLAKEESLFLTQTYRQYHDNHLRNGNLDDYQGSLMDVQESPFSALN